MQVVLLHVLSNQRANHTGTGGGGDPSTHAVLLCFVHRMDDAYTIDVVEVD